MANQKYKFERLTPIDNMDLDVYEEAIDYVFSNSDVKNVAISGAYSAGKSSVLASYKKKHGELRFLHISLAHFKSTDQENKSEVKESTLEGKILNQLIHQIPSEKIPQTNFRVKKTVSARSLSAATIGAVLFFISIIHLLFFSVWKNYVSFLPVSLIKSILMPSTHPYALIAELPNYIKHLNIGWPEMFSTTLSEQSLTEAQIRKYSIFSLYYSDDDIIKLINKNNCLSDYISEAYDYLTIDNPNIDRLIHCKAIKAARYIHTLIDFCLNPALKKSMDICIGCGVGICTGTIMITKVGMRGKESDKTAENETGIVWVGSTTNYANRYCSLAYPCEIFIDENTYSEIEDSEIWTKTSRTKT